MALACKPGRPKLDKKLLQIGHEMEHGLDFGRTEELV